jgi:hypothetical protein
MKQFRGTFGIMTKELKEKLQSVEQMLQFNIL